MVAAGFVDRKDLDGVKIVSGRPLDHLGECLGITDTQIMPSSQGK